MKIQTAIFLCLAILIISPVVKSDISVNWVKTSEYKDIEAADENQKKFEKRLFLNLEKHFNKLNKKLPDNHQLLINVTNIDLAGRVLPGVSLGLNTPRDVRIVEYHHFPKIKLNYRLQNGDGEPLKSGDAVLKSISFLDKIETRKINRDEFDYEKIMLTDWFNKTFSEFVTKK